MSRKSHPDRTWGGRPMTLRARLTLWSIAWLFVVTLAFALVLNGVFGYFLDHAGSVAALPSQAPAVVAPAQPPGRTATVSGPAAAPAIPVPAPPATVQLPPAVAVSDLAASARRLLWLVSASAVGLAAFVGGVGSWLMTKRLLRRLARASAVTQGIRASTLGERIPLGGPRDELADLVDSMNALLDRLELSIQEQQQFVAAVSHELRTPLAVLQTNLEVTAGDPEAGLDDYRRMAGALQPSVQRLALLIERLLLLAREASVAEFDVVHLGPLVEEIVDQLRPSAERQQVRLQLAGDAGVAVRGSATLLTHLMRNLVDNAIAYNRPGGSVDVRLWQDDGLAVVAVADSGMGIPPSMQTRLFERFYRGEAARTRRPNGLGLGLAIVQHLTRQHGGAVSVSSKAGAGSTFTVRLPLASETAIAEPEPLEPLTPP